MSKSRVSSSKRKAHSTKRKVAPKELKVNRYLGVHLGGGKSDKTVVAVLEHFPHQDKVFLTQVNHRVRSEREISADLHLYQLLESTYQNVKSVGIDAPMSWPHCMKCRLKCPGYEICEEEPIQWMWKHYRKVKKKKKPHKLFTPYTQRCSELYISSELEQPYFPDEALGSNSAPLFARAQFLKRRTKTKLSEVVMDVSVARIASHVRATKTQIKNYSHSLNGKEARSAILNSLVDRNEVFVYSQDIFKLADHLYSFKAFISALTVFYCDQGFKESAPKGFPKKELWPCIPKL